MKSQHSTESISSSLTVRPEISEVLDDFQWLETIRKDDEINRFKSSSSLSSQKPERCMICTLPFGSCQHTTEWRDDMMISKFIDNSAENEIEDSLGVLTYSPDRSSNQNRSSIDMDDDVDLEHLSWEIFDDRAVDKIGETKTSLFTPIGRFWHSATKVGNFLVVYGGLRIRNEKTFHDIRTVEDPNDFEFLTDLRIYNIEKQSWHGMNANGHNVLSSSEVVIPPGRYGTPSPYILFSIFLLFFFCFFIQVIVRQVLMIIVY
jgi:hypothetical protein